MQEKDMILIALVVSFILLIIFYIIYQKNSLIDILKTKLNELNIINSKLTTKLDEFTQIKTDLAKKDAFIDEYRKALSDYKEELAKTRAILNESKLKNEELKNIHKNQLLQLNEEKELNLSRVLNTYNELKEEFKTLQQISLKDKEQISHLKTALNEQKNAMEDKITALNRSEQRLKLEFENLANKIFNQNSERFNMESKESLNLILNPMQTKLNEFKQKLEDVYEKQSKETNALQFELRNLKELNTQMSIEANRLTNALKNDNKKQGLWGEMVLERVLENSGLRKGIEFEREVTLVLDEDKHFRPDVVVNLPNNRHIIIDAKTSLNAYKEYIYEQNDDIKKLKLASHIRSIKEHVKNLSLKQYENLKGINSLDFIFMFLPIEAALLLAIENDTNLYDEAYKQKIILVSPTTLLVALRAVENSWRYEKQAQNIALVYSRAEELYKKFNNFTQDLQKVGKALQLADESYNQAFKKLSLGKGNLIFQATELKKISNIKPKNELDKELVENA